MYKSKREQHAAAPNIISQRSFIINSFTINMDLFQYMNRSINISRNNDFIQRRRIDAFTKRDKLDWIIIQL